MIRVGYDFRARLRRRCQSFICPVRPAHLHSLSASLELTADSEKVVLAVADVIVFDQRDFGQAVMSEQTSMFEGARPVSRLTCTSKRPATVATTRRRSVADTAKRGIDFRGYTVLECADDVNVLQALGYKQITLVGTGFSSQWSFAMYASTQRRQSPSRYSPARRTAPMAAYDMPSQVFAAIQRSWWEAEKDAALKPYLPPGGLTAAAREVMMRLDHQPAKVKTTVAGGGEIEVVLGRQDSPAARIHTAIRAGLAAGSLPRSITATGPSWSPPGGMNGTERRSIQSDR